MKDHGVNTELLLAYVSGELEPDDVARVDRAVAESPDLAERLAQTRSILESLRHASSSAPAGWIDQAVNLFDRLTPSAPPAWLNALQRAVVRLVFDSRQQPALAGYRNSAAPVQLSYESDAAEIDLELQPPGAGLAEGQIWGHVSAGSGSGKVEAALLSIDDRTCLALTTCDDKGVFRLGAPSGVYNLAIMVAGSVVHLQEIEM